MNSSKPSTQQRQNEWFIQWDIFNGAETVFLFKDWIYPNHLEDLIGKDILEAGCGGGPHTELMAPYANSVTAVDLNTADLAKKRLSGFKNVQVIQADIASMDLARQFDIVFSIAVVHHTDDPDLSVENLKRHVKPGGKIILWVYAKEGNGLVEYGIEPLRKFLLRHLDRNIILMLSKLITILLYIPVYSLYLLPFKSMPYYGYFENYRRLPFQRNWLNIFDKLNAPQVIFLDKNRVKSWFNGGQFKILHMSHYKGVSWRMTAWREP